MTVFSLSLYLGSLESCKTLEQTFIFQISTFNPPNLFMCFCHHIPINSIDPFSADKPTHNLNSSNCSDEWLTLKTTAFKLITLANLCH